MDGTRAPPPPDFSGLAEQYGLRPDQLQTLISHPQGEKIIESLIGKAGFVQGSQQANAYNNAAQGYHHGLGQGQAGTAAQQSLQQQQGFVNMQSPPTPVTDEEFMREAFRYMNPIAREKYEPVFKLLGIRCRYSGASYNGQGWSIHKNSVKGTALRQSWSAPLEDPGCSLAVWDAMVGELLDNCRKADGTDNDNRPQVTR